MTRAQVATLAAALASVGVVLTSAVLSDGGALIEVMRAPEKPHPPADAHRSAWEHATRKRAIRWDFRDGAPVLKRTPKKLATLVRAVWDGSAVAA